MLEGGSQWRGWKRFVENMKEGRGRLWGTRRGSGFFCGGEKGVVVIPDKCRVSDMRPCFFFSTYMLPETDSSEKLLHNIMYLCSYSPLCKFSHFPRYFEAYSSPSSSTSHSLTTLPPATPHPRPPYQHPRAPWNSGIYIQAHLLGFLAQRLCATKL